MVRKTTKRDGSEWTTFGIIFLVALGIVWLAVNYPVSPSTYSPSAMPGSYFSPSEEFALENVLNVSGTTIAVGHDCLAIIADTTPERAEAISMGIENKTGERPSAWDGWASMLSTFNVTFEATTLYGKSGTAYLSRAIFRQGSNILDLDMRPSDAIALALRTRTPIYVNMTLLREDGENIC